MFYVGLDVHQRCSSICVLNESGQEVKHQTVKGHPRRVVSVLRTLEEPFEICFEASTNYGWLTDQLRLLTERVVVAHPGQLRLIFRSKQKNDRADASKLAKLLFLGEVPTVYVPSMNTRTWRSLIEHRQHCIGARTRAKNALRALLRTHGVELPGRSKLWSDQGKAWIQALELPSRVIELERDQLLDDVQHQTRKLKRIERELLNMAKAHPGITLLRTVPGVGIRTAEAFVAYIDNPHRFERNKAIGCYIGLVPSQDASAGVNRLGRVTKEGPATLRKLLVEAAWQGTRRSAKIRAYYERVCQGRKDRKKKALIATAHYLARAMLAMLQSGEVWREEMETSRCCAA